MVHGEHGFWVQWTVNRFERMKRGRPVDDYILVTDTFGDVSNLHFKNITREIQVYFGIVHSRERLYEGR